MGEMGWEGMDHTLQTFTTTRAPAVITNVRSLVILSSLRQSGTFGAPEFWCLGTRTWVPPLFLGVFFLYYEPVCAGIALIKLGNIGDT